MREMMKKHFGKMPLWLFATVVSLGTLLLYNLPFFGFVRDNAPEQQWLLTGSLVVVMLSLNFMMAYLTMFCLRLVGRILLAILAVINATALYFEVTYSVLIDEITIGNVLNTRYSEASGFFSWQLWGFMIVLGLLPALFCLLQPVDYGKGRRLGIACGSSLGLILAGVLLNLGQVLWIGQNDTELGGLLQPWSYLVNTGRVMAIRQHKQQEEILLPDGTITDRQRTAVVLVIGESARRANFQLYGYERPTNPLLSKQEGLTVFPALSCATYTTAGTKAILEYTATNDLYEILPNYAMRCGADVAWRTYNWGEPPVHVDDYKNQHDLADLYPEADPDHDELLLAGLKERIDGSDKEKVLIVLHSNTSHGPEYTARYPKAFEQFKPVPTNVEEGNKDTRKLVNAYDNSILYTDYLLSSIIDILRSVTDRQTAMIYVSDHGESLGEGGLFMHGVPMGMAPREQYEIPFICWLSDGFRNYREGLTGTTTIEQHYVFHSVLDLLSIDSPVYNPELDIFRHE